MDEICKRIAAEIEAKLFATMLGGCATAPKTALRLKGNSFETVNLDENGNIVEPAKPCPQCGPLLCWKHMALVS